MENLTCSSTSKLKKLAEKAIAEWNKVLSGFATITLIDSNDADMHIDFGKVDRTTQSTRAAQCETHDIVKPDGTKRRKWSLVLASDMKWQITFLERLLGIGQENAYGAILHEIGHVFTFPHSVTYYHIMSPELGSTVFSKDEITGLRKYYERYLK